MFSCYLCAISFAPLIEDLDIAICKCEKTLERRNAVHKLSFPSEKMRKDIRLQLNLIITNYQQTEKKNSFTVKALKLHVFYFDSISLF